MSSRWIAVATLLVLSSQGAGAVAGDQCDGHTGDNCEDDSWYAETLAVRSTMPHAPDGYATPPGVLPIYPPMKRLTMAELKKPANVAYAKRRRPYILTDGMEGWGAVEEWQINTKKPAKRTKLAKLFKNAVNDFYPYNMMKPGTHPYLYRFQSGLDEVLHPSGQFRDPNQPFACDEGCRYLHMQLTPTMWSTLEDLGDIPKDRHAHFQGDEWWMSRCMADKAVQEEYHLKTHWKIILIGSQGSGMFNHTDTLQTSSWHGHVQGRKWWYVCGVNKGHGPKRDKLECMESVLEPGETLYYGRGWSHHTQNLDSPSMTVTGTVVHESNYRDVSDKLYSECTASALSFDFSAALCDSLDKCYSLWEKVLVGKDTKRYKPWRQVASRKQIKLLESRDPSENNYDGRNHIGG